MSDAAQSTGSPAPEPTTQALPEGNPANDNGTGAPANDNATPDYWDVDALPEDVAGRMVRMKIDGQEVVVPLAKALKGTQKFKAATKKEMAAAAKVREAEEQVKSWLADPYEPLTKADEATLEKTILKLVQSEDPRVQKTVDRAFQRLMKLQEMKPEERERESLAEERARLEAERRAWEEEQEQRRQEAELAPMRKRIEGEFKTAAEKAGIKPTARIMQRMIEMGLEVNRAGLQWSPDDIADQLREELDDEVRGYVGSLDGDSIARVLGDEGAKRFREREVARVRGKQAAPAKPTFEREKPPPKERFTTEQLRERWRGR